MNIYRIPREQLFGYKFLADFCFCQSAKTEDGIRPGFLQDLWSEADGDDSFTLFLCRTTESKKATCSRSDEYDPQLELGPILGFAIVQDMILDGEYFEWKNEVTSKPLQEETTLVAGQLELASELTVICSRGCGQRLIQTAEAFIRDEKQHKFVILDALYTAEGFYLKLGYRRVRGWRSPKPAKGRRTAEKDGYRHRGADYPANLMYKRLRT